MSETIVKTGFCGVEYSLEYDEVFSIGSKKQYFLVVGAELQEEYFTFNPSISELEKLVLQYNYISPDRLFQHIETAYNEGVNDVKSEMNEMINKIKLAISYHS